MTNALAIPNLNSLMSEVEGVIAMDFDPHTIQDIYDWLAAKGYPIEDGAWGFHVTLPSGYVMSIQCGQLNYCENREVFPSIELSFEACLQSTNAELAVFKPDGNWYIPEDAYRDDDYTPSNHVWGWQTTDEVMEMIAYFS